MLVTSRIGELQSGLPRICLKGRGPEGDNMNNIKKVEAWEYILRRYVKSERDVEQTISKIGNDLRKDRAFVIAFAKVRKSIDPSFAD